MNTQAQQNDLIDAITRHQKALREALWELSEFEYSEATRRSINDAVKCEEQLTGELAFVKSFVAQGI